MEVFKWGDDLVRDCRQLRKLESWGLYPAGWHDRRCPLMDCSHRQTII